MYLPEDQATEADLESWGRFTNPRTVPVRSARLRAELDGRRRVHKSITKSRTRTQAKRKYPDLQGFAGAESADE